MSEIIQIISGNLIYFYVFMFFLGACFASFFNVYSLRYLKIVETENAQEVSSWFDELKLDIPKKIKDLAEQNINLSYPSSHCYECKTPLKWYHNIPILSFLFLGGKCGFCKAKISFQYPIVEFIGGLILLVVAHVFFIKNGYQEKTFLMASVFIMVTFLLLLIDYKTMFLPDNLNYFLLWFGLLGITTGYKLIDINVNEAIYAVISSFMFFFILGFIGKRLKGVAVIGGGDLKLIAAIAPFVGIKGVFFTIFFSPVFGLLFWIIFKQINKGKAEFPYGPSLILSSWVFIFYGNEVLNLLGLRF